MEQDDSRLFIALYEEYLVPLKKIAVRMGIEYDDIEDLVHDTLLTYYDKYPMNWNGKQKRKMLSRILYSKWIDSYRKHIHYAEVSIDNTDDTFIMTKKLLERDTLSYVIENETYREVRDLIEGMKKDWHDVIVLHVIEARPIKEVCEILGIPGTVCRSRLARARKYLRGKLQN